MLQAEIAKAMPKTLGDTEKFMKGGSSEELKGSLKGNVSNRRTKPPVASRAPPRSAEGGGSGKNVKPIPGEPAPCDPGVNGAEAMPAPKPDATFPCRIRNRTPSSR